MKPDNRATEEMLEEMDAETRTGEATGTVWPDNFDGSDLEEGMTGQRVDRAPPELIHYVMDLEALIKWFALMFSYRVYDTETGEETLVQNDPIWTTYDERGTHLAAAERLQATWNKVMHDD